MIEFGHNPDTNLYRMGPNLLVDGEKIKDYPIYWVNLYVSGQITVEELERELHRIICGESAQ